MMIILLSNIIIKIISHSNVYKVNILQYNPDVAFLNSKALKASALRDPILSSSLFIQSICFIRANEIHTCHNGDKCQKVLSLMQMAFQIRMTIEMIHLAYPIILASSIVLSDLQRLLNSLYYYT